MNNDTSSLKWDRKPPPMEEAAPEDKFRFLQLVRSDAVFLEKVKANVGQQFSQALDVEILEKAKLFESDTQIYISPESVSDIILLLRMAASGNFSIHNDDVILDKIKRNRYSA